MRAVFGNGMDEGAQQYGYAEFVSGNGVEEDAVNDLLPITGIDTSLGVKVL